jgi:hypothetical protein
LPQPLAKPEGIELPALSSEAMSAARRFGDALAKLEPRYAAHLAGVIYTATLPETYRAVHGIIYRLLS